MITNNAKKAFTMLELLVVIALIGTLAAFLLPRVAKWFGKSEQAEIQLKFSAIKEALNQYRLEFGSYPTSREGLMALTENPRPSDDRYKRAGDLWPMVKSTEIADKMGNQFGYNCPPEKDKTKFKHFEIIYLGKTQSEDDPQYMIDGL